MSEDQTNAASTAICRPLTSAEPLRLQVIGTSRHGQIVEVASTRVTIGSGPQCTLRLRAPGVQPFHCLIVREPTGTFARALSGETLLNGEKFREELLQPGDRLRVGCVELQIGDSDTRQPNLSQPSTTAERPSGDPPNLELERLRSDELLERIERIERQLHDLRASEEGRPADHSSSAESGLGSLMSGCDAPPRPSFDEEVARLAQERQDLASQLDEAKALHTVACQTISQLEYERDELFRRCELQDSEAERVRAEYERTLSGERLSRAELASQLEELISKVAELESQMTALQSDLAFAQSAVDAQRSETEYCQAELERTRTEVLQWQTEANRWEEYARWNEDEVGRFQAEMETMRQEADRWRNEAQQHEQAAVQLRTEAEKAQRTVQRVQHEEEHRRGQLELLLADAALAQQELAQVLADAEHDQQEAANWCHRAERIRLEAKRWKSAAEIQRLEALRSRKSIADLQAELERWQAIAEINQSEAERCQVVAEKSQADAAEWRQQADELRSETERLRSEFEETKLELARRPEAIADSVAVAPIPPSAPPPDYCEQTAAPANAVEAAANPLTRRRDELARLALQFARVEVELPPPAPPEPVADSEVELHVELNDEVPVEVDVEVEIERAESNVACVETTDPDSAPAVELDDEPGLEWQLPSKLPDESLDRDLPDAEVYVAETLVDDNAPSAEVEDFPPAVDEPGPEDRSEATFVDDEVPAQDDDTRCDTGEPIDAEDVMARLSRAGIWRDNEMTDSPTSAMPSETSVPDEDSILNRPLLELVEEPEGEDELEPPGDLDDSEETLVVDASAIPAGSAGDDDTIECYMERLLQRVRGKHAESTVVQRRSRDQERSPVTEAELDLESPVEPSEPAPLTESEYMPRSQAPEITVDLKTMRAIGNERRQKDILSHAERTYSNKTRGKFAGAVLGVAVACGSYFYLNTYPEFAAVGLVAGSGIALYWLLQANRFRKQLFDSLRLNTEELRRNRSGKVEE
jgi:hypothetical protein